ncbi:MAG: sigma-54-dependent transcriptional regulator [Granulosicoccus sp.]
MKRLLLVEDEEVILKALTRLLERNHYDVCAVSTVEEAIKLQPQSFDLVLADLRLPGAEGTSIIPLADPAPVVIMTSHASVRSAVDAMRHGAIDYIAKPFDHDELLMVIERSLMQNLMQAQNRALRLDVQRIQPAERHVQGTVMETILASLLPMKESRRYLHLYGEKGTDREGMARAIHANSDRSDAPFVVADVGAGNSASDIALLLGSNSEIHRGELPPGGLLQAAQNGTIVLRHPETFDASVQNQLAGVLTKGRISASDGGRQRIVNVRVLSIAHEPIDTLIKSDSLTQELADLFAGDQIELPPLRMRRKDILPLAYQTLGALERRHALKNLKLAPDAEAALTANDWPGNVTELDSMLTRAVLVARKNTLTVDDLGIGDSANGSRDLNLDEYFRYFVLRNQNTLSETELASRLGISRKALWERRQKMSLPRTTNEDLSSSPQT